MRRALVTTACVIGICGLIAALVGAAWRLMTPTASAGHAGRRVALHYDGPCHAATRPSGGRGDRATVFDPVADLGLPFRPTARHHRAPSPAQSGTGESDPATTVAESPRFNWQTWRR